MKKYTNYRIDLLTGLLSLGTLSACVHTRPGLPMYKPNASQKGPGSSSAVRLQGGVSEVTNPMVLDEQILEDLQTNHFLEKSIKYWLDKGLNINASDNLGCTILGHAIQYHIADNKTDKFIRDNVQAIIELGADVNATDKHGTTPLMLAALEGHEHVVQVLLNNGADVNATDKHGITPLMLAALEGHEHVVNILLGHDADPRKSLKATAVDALPPWIKSLMESAQIAFKEGMMARDFVKVTDCEEEDEDDKAKKARIIAALDRAEAKLQGAAQPTVTI